MRLRNTTHIDTPRLREAILRGIDGWPHDEVDATVRFSRGADFSGTCFYKVGRIYVNIGRHVRYPYLVRTHVARARSEAGYWWRELYGVQVSDACQLAYFVFMHEFYHWLVRQARRNVRQKESRCDRFAVRALVDGYGASVTDAQGRAVPREAWDFQDLEGFVAAARLGRRIGRARGRVGA